VACIREHGYANTSTNMIVDRAGVSRGALHHHFPTKADLVVATIEHIFEHNLERFHRAFADIPDGMERLPAAIELLWEAMSSRETRYVWIELVIGTRTDPFLHKKVVETTERLSEAVRATFDQVVAGTPLPDVALLIATSVLDGLLVMQAGGLPEAKTREALDRLKDLARLAPALAAISAGSPARDGGSNDG
jgi:AcrR family transcriptional regulator